MARLRCGSKGGGCSRRHHAALVRLDSGRAQRGPDESKRRTLHVATVRVTAGVLLQDDGAAAVPPGSPRPLRGGGSPPPRSVRPDEGIAAGRAQRGPERFSLLLVLSARAKESPGCGGGSSSWAQVDVRHQAGKAQGRVGLEKDFFFVPPGTDTRGLARVFPGSQRSSDRVHQSAVHVSTTFHQIPKLYSSWNVNVSRTGPAPPTLHVTTAAADDHGTYNVTSLPCDSDVTCSHVTSHTSCGSFSVHPLYWWTRFYYSIFDFASKCARAPPLSSTQVLTEKRGQVPHRRANSTMPSIKSEHHHQLDVSLDSWLRGLEDGESEEFGESCTMQPELMLSPPIIRAPLRLGSTMYGIHPMSDTKTCPAKSANICSSNRSKEHLIQNVRNRVI
jgi:hypothetical protein